MYLNALQMVSSITGLKFEAYNRLFRKMVQCQLQLGIIFLIL